MNETIDIWTRPEAEVTYAIAGWHQWADAGNMSSGLPQYLISQLGAEPIGQLQLGGCYLFQVPGTHHFMRPGVTLEQGFIKSVESQDNDIFYWSDGRKGLVIFLGEEPHLNVQQYGETFLDAMEELGVQRIIALGGVYGAMPYDRDREIHAVYSVPELKDELADLAVKFSDYAGGSTIGTMLAHMAQQRAAELIDFYAFVPAYDFSPNSNAVQGIRIDNDFKAWHEVMRRINHLLGLEIDLAELEQHSRELVANMDAKVAELEQKMPELQVRDHLRRVDEGFSEQAFMPLDDVWERELGDLLDDLGD